MTQRLKDSALGPSLTPPRSAMMFHQYIFNGKTSDRRASNTRDSALFRNGFSFPVMCTCTFRGESNIGEMVYPLLGRLWQCPVIKIALNMCKVNFRKRVWQRPHLFLFCVFLHKNIISLKRFGDNASITVGHND